MQWGCARQDRKIWEAEDKCRNRTAIHGILVYDRGDISN